MNKIVLSICDWSGVWSMPYVRKGYEVIMVDIGNPEGEWRISNRLWRVGADITQFDFPWQPYAVLAAPPCTCFCRPGSRWWKRQDESGQTARDVATMRACLRICQAATGWWALENPPGRHHDLVPELGKASWQYQPWEYGDPWTKQTYIWGTAKKPPINNPIEPEPLRRTPNGKSQGRIAYMSSSHKRQRERTPLGFALAFAKTNP